LSNNVNTTIQFQDLTLSEIARNDGQLLSPQTSESQSTQLLGQLSRNQSSQGKNTEEISDFELSKTPEHFKYTNDEKEWHEQS